ncbi:MAG: hypothetical protein GF411_15605 [Candidatus Lokiarchaeota archaeon]|nr:hypothetical protein [Candidatus Lokiarchaeota archaeon]
MKRLVIRGRFFEAYQNIAKTEDFQFRFTKSGIGCILILLVVNGFMFFFDNENLGRVLSVSLLLVILSNICIQLEDSPPEKSPLYSVGESK